MRQCCSYRVYEQEPHTKCCWLFSNYFIFFLYMRKKFIYILIQQRFMFSAYWDKKKNRELYMSITTTSTCCSQEISIRYLFSFFSSFFLREMQAKKIALMIIKLSTLLKHRWWIWEKCKIDMLHLLLHAINDHRKAKLKIISVLIW